MKSFRVDDGAELEPWNHNLPRSDGGYRLKNMYIHIHYIYVLTVIFSPLKAETWASLNFCLLKLHKFKLEKKLKFDILIICLPVHR